MEIEMKLRSIILLVCVIFGCLVVASPSYARLISLAQNVGHDQLKAACGAAGGEFSDAPDGGGGYGCGTNCKGGKGSACYVACDKGGSCVGQTPGRLVANVTLVQFLSGEFIREVVVAPDDTGTPNHKSPAPGAPGSPGIQ
jgi:hypothetical protein